MEIYFENRYSKTVLTTNNNNLKKHSYNQVCNLKSNNRVNKPKL